LVLLGCGVAGTVGIVGVAPADASPMIASLTAVEQALEALPPTPDTAWGPAANGDQEVLTISAAAPAGGVRRLLAIAGQFGRQVRVRRSTGRFTEQVLGGDAISDGQIVCSAGFNVTKDDQTFLLTAGHCTQGLPDWQDIGPSVASSFPGTDFGLVRNDWGDGPGAVNRYDGSVIAITGAGTATLGEHVCASGQTTGVTCGSVTAVNQTVDFDDGNVVRGLIETNVHTDHGDSGGPLYDGAVGLGTVSGGDGQTDYFQPLAPELAAYGVTLAQSASLP
jgi:streptogrisin D